MLPSVLALFLAVTPPRDVGARIHASDEAAQSLQGPLDGAWTLYNPTGKALYAFEFVDPIGGAGPLNGAWRDLNGHLPHEDVGAFLNISRRGGGLVLVLPSHDGQPATIVRLNKEDGVWLGWMSSGDPASRAVVLRRD